MIKSYSHRMLIGDAWNALRVRPPWLYDLEARSHGSTIDGMICLSEKSRKHQLCHTSCACSAIISLNHVEILTMNADVLYVHSGQGLRE